MTPVTRVCPNCEGLSSVCLRCLGTGKITLIVKTEYERRLEDTELFYQDLEQQYWRD